MKPRKEIAHVIGHDTFYDYSCTNCGEELQLSYVYCPTCGSQIEWEEVEK